MDGESTVLILHRPNRAARRGEECNLSLSLAASVVPTRASTVSGCTRSTLHAISQRGEDPDTLFFSRRLVMEGDTELGLLVKNTLDALDMDVLKPGKVLRTLLNQAA